MFWMIVLREKKAKRRSGEAAGNSQEVVVNDTAGRQGRVGSQILPMACGRVRREGVKQCVAMDNKFMAGAWASRRLKRKVAGF